jgi:hypothetical protein
MVCLVFLLHLRSAFVAIVTLPLGVLARFIVMHYQGVNANIMSLGGIAIAIGAMVDAAIVMIENATRARSMASAHPEVELSDSERWRVIGDAAAEVGPHFSFRYSSSHSRSFRYSPCRRRKAGSSRPSPIPRPMPWLPRRALRDPRSGADGVSHSGPYSPERAIR